MSFVSETNQRMSGDAGVASLSGLPTTCVFLGLVVFMGLGVYSRRKAQAKRISPLPLSNPKGQEAGLEFTSHYVPDSSLRSLSEKQEKENESSSICETALTAAPPPLPPPPSQALPGAGPVFAQRPLPPHPPPFTPPMLDLSASSNNPSPADAALPDLFSSSSSSTFDSSDLPPRRRSYTKMTTEGTEFSGEIVAAEGWRRHTRVFGGGVCEACLESERRMSQ
ncbi:hypothetical protein B7463_g8889, partial [Scytalidium lignicola]